MGFYGNITNMARTSFTFDKTYPNRYAMEQAAKNDEVFIGRYVLVDYDTENNDQSIFNISYKWIDEESGAIFFGQSFPSTSSDGAYRWSSLAEGEVIVVPFTGDYNQAEPDATTNQYWKCTGVDEYGYNVFEAITDSANSYTQNYNIDTTEYGNGRGYDSTAWQKVSVNGVTKYVMVAELNSVVPSFGITADAPTITPLRPHWGKDSTNVYYDLHWQVPWGFRIKGAHPDTTLPKLDDYGYVLNDTVTISRDEKEYPSDEYTVWQRAESDPNTGEITTLYARYSEQKDGVNNLLNRQIEWVADENAATQQPAAVYYNKDGFAPEKISYSTDKTYSGWDEDEQIPNSISLTPTGRSGYGYNDHDNLGQDYEKADSMELSVMLPALGDAMAHVWDLVYGGKEANNNRKTRNMDVAWENARYALNRSGLRMVPTVEESETGGHLDYREDQVNTIAGAINSVHDLMGMIVVPESTEELEMNIDSLDENRIYYDTDRQDYYRKKTGYAYTELEQAWEYGDEIFNDNDEETGIPKGHEGSPYIYEPVEVSEDNFDPNVYYELVDEEYIPLASDAVYSSSKTYYGRKLKDPAGNYREVDLIDWEPTKYWYQDYIGGSYGADDELHQDYIQSTTYEFGRKYYKDLVAEVQESISEIPYEANKYYYKDDNGSFILDASVEPVAGRTYYKLRRQLTSNDLISVPIYVPNQYYYQDRPNEYKLATTISMPSGRNLFYRLNPDGGAEIVNKKIYVRSFTYEPITLDSSTYTPGTFYIAKKENPSSTDDNDYELDPLYVGEDELNSFDPNKTYYILNETLTATTDVSKALDLEHPFSVTPFIAGVFFRKVGNNYYAISQSDIEPGNTNYYVFWNALRDSHWTSDIALDGNSEYNWRTLLKDWYEAGIIDTDPTINEGTAIYSYSDYAMQRQQDFFAKSTYHKRVANGLGTAPNLGYNYLLQEKPTPEDNDYTLITAEDEYSSALKYAYLNDEDEWAEYATYAEETWNELVAANKLYSYVEPTYAILKSVTPVDEDAKFYYPYKYYEKAGEQYHLLTAGHIPTIEGQPVTTYEKFSYYVLADSTGIHQFGEEWNPSIKYVPSTIKLGVRKEQNMLEGIAGFARDLSTIHGLILKLLNTLELDDSATRDTRKLRGMLNTLNDMFTKIHELQPGDAVYVNDYGQISSAPIETNKWIDITVNSRVKDPSIVINHHGIIAADNTTSNSDVNNNGDTIQLYTPIIDEAGHVVGNNTETVTLPYGFKHINGSNSDAVTDAPSAIAVQAAESTQDTINFVGSNKWIKANIAADDTVKFGHLVQNIDIVAASATDLNDGTDTITIQDITNDEAGHIRSNKSHEYTLPFGYKTVKVGEDNLVAENTQDDIEVIAGDAWVELAGSANAHTITATHASAQATAASIDVNSGNVTPAFGATFNIPTLGFDAKGHYKESASTTVTIPAPSLTNGVGNVVTGLTLTPSTGALVEAKENIGNIALGTYTSLLSTPEISASDSIGSAISKLEKDLKDEVAERERAEADEVDARSEADEDLSQAIADEVTARTNAIEALDMTEVSAGVGQVIGTVSQTNGLISATVKTLAASDIPNIELSQVVDTDNNTDLPTMLSDLFAGNIVAGSYERTNIDPITEETTVETVDVKYNELYGLIASLSNQINDLKTRVETLENSAPESQTEP